MISKSSQKGDQNTRTSLKTCSGPHAATFQKTQMKLPKFDRKKKKGTANKKRKKRRNNTAISVENDMGKEDGFQNMEQQRT